MTLIGLNDEQKLTRELANSCIHSDKHTRKRERMVTNMKKMKGFMCHTPVSTSVCMAHDYRSVSVPRRLDTSLLHQPRPINGPKCIRLGGKQAISASVRSYPVSSVKKDIKNQPDQVIKSLAVSDQVFQVVVMRVSLHCQACAGKVKKHLSKMEGVTSFSIDLEAKRITVVGHVSPSCVLKSVSKVKKAEFWPIVEA